MSDSKDFLEFSGVREPRAKGDLLNAKDFPILEGMSPLHLRILNDSSRMMHVSKGVEMLHEGDAPHDLYFVLAGKLAIAKRVGSQLKVLAQLKHGTIYGEFGALRRKSRYASVYTAEPSKVVRVELSAIQQVLDVDPEFKNRLTLLLKHRMLDSFFFSHPVFQKLPNTTRTELAKELPTKFFERGTRLFTQGEKPASLYLILSGEVEVRYLNHAKEEVLLEIRRDNDLLGEVALKGGAELAYSSVAASDLDVLVLDKPAMDLMRKRHQETYAELESHINKRASRTVARLKENID